jgi:hypothetical protein
VELRGLGPELLVIVSIDRRVFSRLAGRGHLGNEIAFQLRARDVEKESAVVWLQRVFRDACARLSPAWAAGYATDEYWAKVMSERPVIRAAGRDFSRFLPGLFWLNFFGPRYVDFIGRESLLSTPAPVVEQVDAGVLLGLGDDPARWNSNERRELDTAVLNVLGHDVFYSTDAPGRPTRAPSWTT